MTKQVVKNYEDLTFSDNFMFGKVMEDKSRCRKVLECLLGRPVGELQEVNNERRMMQTSDGKMIRLDIFTKDENAMYDVEMQNLNHKSPDTLDLPKRSRFYQSEVDVDFLNRGSSFKELPENNVVFICTFDPFGRGKPVYIFENMSDEKPPKPLNDGTKKYFFNCTYEDVDIPEELIHFYEFIRTGIAEDVLTADLKKAVEENNMNYIYRSEYLRQRLLLEDAKEEGIEEGIERGMQQGIQQERVHTEEQRIRAEAAEAQVKALQEELDKLKKQVADQ